MDNEPTTKSVVSAELAKIEGVQRIDIESTCIVTVMVADYPVKVAVQDAIRGFRKKWDDNSTIFSIITTGE